MIDIREDLGPQHYFKYNSIFAKACGVWPFQSKLSKIISLSLWLTQEIILAIAELIKFTEIYTDTDLLLEAVPPFLYNRGNDVLLANGLINRQKIKSLFAKIQNHWNSLTDESEIQILAETLKFGHFLNLGYIALIYAAVLQCMLLPLVPLLLDYGKPLNESRPLQPLFMVQFYVDPDKYFISILAQNYVCALVSPMPIIAINLIFMNCINHICGMVRILGFRIDNISKNLELKSESKESEYKQLCDCIIMHQNIFDFCDDINSAFSTSFLLALFINMVIMSFTGMAMVIKMDDFSQFNDVLRFGVFTIAQMFHLFCFNYMGQNIFNAIEMLDLKIYDIRWYELPMKSQVLVLVMILKNYRPTAMQAVLFPLSLETFTSVMKTSISYFTVLKCTR